MRSSTAAVRKVARTVRAVFESLPENVVGEILDGELHVSPRPRPRHSHAEARLGTLIDSGFDLGVSGPGGWVILVEPGVELEPGDEADPDVAGWKRERFAAQSPDEPIRVVPDWVCEVLSPSTKRYDRVEKMPYYARHGVRWLWFLEPLEKTLTVWELARGKWAQRSFFSEGGKVRAQPFDAIELDLDLLWPADLAGAVPKPESAPKKPKRRRPKG